MFEGWEKSKVERGQEEDLEEKGGKHPALATCYLSAEGIEAEANADVRREIVATPIGAREYMLNAKANVGVDKAILFAQIEARTSVVIIEVPRIGLTIE